MPPQASSSRGVILSVNGQLGCHVISVICGLFQGSDSCMKHLAICHVGHGSSQIYRKERMIVATACSHNAIVLYDQLAEKGLLETLFGRSGPLSGLAGRDSSLQAMPQATSQNPRSARFLAHDINSSYQHATLYFYYFYFVSCCSYDTQTCACLL
jgi:hypothetical protein